MPGHPLPGDQLPAPYRSVADAARALRTDGTSSAALTEAALAALHALSPAPAVAPVTTFEPAEGEAG